jgi:ferredoxin-NADP reductase
MRTGGYHRRAVDGSAVRVPTLHWRGRGRTLRARTEGSSPMSLDSEDRRVIVADAPEYNATLVRRVDRAADLANFWVTLDGPPVPFKPGQYITIGVVADDRLWQRPYSVASAPAVAGSEGYELYVRLVPVARFTTLLWRLQPGARLQVSRPEGGFTLGPGDRRTHLFVSTGTAIAPFLSMIRATQLVRMPRKAIVLHGVSYVSDLGYRELLEGMQRDGSYPLRYVPTVSRPQDPRNAGWRGRTGRVEQIVGAVCDDLGLGVDQTVVYLSGNPEMILNVERILMDRGFPEFRVKKELYWPQALRPEWVRRSQTKDLTGAG